MPIDLKTVKTVNSLSGGKTSSYIAAHYPADLDIFSLVRVKDAAVRFPDEKVRKEVEDRIQAPFIGTAEDDTIIYTMLDLEQYIGRPITWITGPTFEDLVKKKGGYLPNKMARYCTTELKTVPIATWLHNNVGPVRMRFGYRANEVSRKNTMVEKLNGRGFTEVKIIVGKRGSKNKWESVDYCQPEFPLIDTPTYKDTIEEFWKDKPVRFAYMNNCVGCWWRTPLLLKKMHQKFPEKMEWFARLENDNKGTFKTEVSYDEILSWKPQYDLFDNDFNECDSGYCGL